MSFVTSRIRGSMQLMKFFVIGIALLFLVQKGFAQLEPPIITNLKDTRFRDVKEDFSTPSLSTSHLLAVRPLVGMVDDESKYTVELLQVQWRWGDPIDLYVMKPAGVKKPPVILYLYGYPSDTDIFKNPKFQEYTTRNGFAAVGFVTALTGHRYHDRPMKKWFVSELQESLSTSAHDVQMVLNYLTSRGDLDMDRVGVLAQFSGASIGILASGVDPRIKVLDAMDPWGDWPTWMADSRFVPQAEQPDYVKPEFLSKVAGMDPVEWMPKMQTKKFRLQQRNFDTETPAAVKDKLQAAAPSNATVVRYKTRVEAGEAIGRGGEKSLDWLKQQLSSLASPEQDQAIATGMPR